MGKKLDEAIKQYFADNGQRAETLYKLRYTTPPKRGKLSLFRIRMDNEILFKLAVMSLNKPATNQQQFDEALRAYVKKYERANGKIKVPDVYEDDTYLRGGRAGRKIVKRGKEKRTPRTGKGTAADEVAK